MKYLLSLIDSPYIDLEYNSSNQLRNFLKNVDIDGLEIIRCGGSKAIQPDMVTGVHLPFFNFWMDYYNKNEKRVLREFGDSKVARKFYQYEPDELHKYFLEDLEFANIHSEYAVFHVGDISNLDYLTKTYYYTDEEVLESSAKIINKMLDNSNFSKWLLFENLYFPGLQFNDIQLAKKFLSSIKYEKIGFMLDIGHLMNTNTSIKTEDEGWEYVEKVFRDFGSLKDYFKGIHLHVSVSGEDRERLQKNPPKLSKNFHKRFEEIYSYVSKIDQHEISTSYLARKIIDTISPEYLVLEYKATKRDEIEEKAIKQMKNLKKICE